MKLDDVKKLHQKKYRTQFGYYLVEGEHLILELIKASRERHSATDITLYVTEDYVSWSDAQQHNFKLIVLNQKQMAQISDTKTPQGIIAKVPLPSRDTRISSIASHIANSSLDTQTKTCIYLHEIQDPGNLGTILRTLAWFGHFRLLISPNSVDIFNSKVVRASMGAIFHLPIELDITLESLTSRFDKFAYLDLGGKSITDTSFREFECYLFGNEARGVPRESLSAFNAEAYTIEGCGNIESLNLASAVSICSFQLKK